MHLDPAFLNAFLGALIHPDTKGSYERVLGFLRDRMGWRGFLLPTYRAIYHTLCERLLAHRVVTRIISDCRKSVDKGVIAIDGQYSTLLSVLYQTPHGQKIDRSVTSDQQDLRTVLSVQCKDAVLLAQ